MKDITISEIRDEKELEILRDKSSFNYTYDEDTMDSLKRHFTLQDSLYLLAKKRGEFAGFCSMDRGWWEENYFFLREILVDENYRKVGLGRKFMERCIEHAKQKNASGIVTETAFDNLPMQQLCLKFGFKEWKNPQWKEGITYKLMLR